ncbi:succinate dehydrogenase iron-sulfur subunit [Candidatus Pantoea edessiphila]|uniref:Succinate dehydrogenase iron-sulfur subunit n=1 Tax=Candidatus Pantoea edessiphila TaxID=2044610 RepID=A0A2P5T0E4_9GAMM|nr:succinate dehydrogenase iron-sulfur subunit [Candidatus Pantoea edessiphila]PPI88057.1 succinate dehydrogenase iron-sulfur subunit [Candidatus Pantoea edessiphila]
MKLWFSIYRYNREINEIPYMQDYHLEIEDNHDMMVLDALIALKEQDPTLSFRRSCREGVCGSDGINMNGKNGLACITPISKLKNKNKKIMIRPLPGLPVIRDLVVDMSQFYAQYNKIKPFLLNNGINHPVREYIQLPIEREKLDGLYECVLCACCSTACPSFWWNPDKFIGPAGLLTLYRFLIDNRDTESNARLDNIIDSFSVFRCHNIMNCVSVCPKGLNPTRAINQIKLMLLKRDN